LRGRDPKCGRAIAKRRNGVATISQEATTGQRPGAEVFDDG
jgi:hypothetical protein